MLRLALGAAALLAVIPSPAQAVTLVTLTGEPVPQPYQRWADNAKIPTVNETVTLSLTDCPGIEESACAMPGRIWLVPGLKIGAGWRLERASLWHELGHQFDYRVMHDAQRDVFRALVGDPRPWVTSPNSPHEKFAEAYRWCALKTRPRRVPGDYEYRPTVRRHQRICTLIARAALLAR